MSPTQEHQSMSEQDAGPARPEVDYEVRVTLTIAIPRRHAFPTIRDELDMVMRGLNTVSKDILPHGTHYHGSMNICVRTAKEVAADRKRAEAKRLRSREPQ